MRREIQKIVEKGYEYYCDACNKKFDNQYSAPIELTWSEKYEHNGFDEWQYCSVECLLTHKFYDWQEEFDEFTLNMRSEKTRDWLIKKVFFKELELKTKP